MTHSSERRPCCGHSIETSCDGYCTLLTCECYCRRFCAHLQVTVPGEARRDERLRGAPLYGWCRHCRAKVDDPHIRTLRPQRDPRMAIYWLGEPDEDAQELEPVVDAHPSINDAPTSTTAVASQLTLFQLLPQTRRRKSPPSISHLTAQEGLSGPPVPSQTHSSRRKESAQMDLLPQNVRAALARYPLGSQEGRGMDALVVVKYFFPAGRYTLYVTEAEFDGDDAQLFGYCLSPFGEDSDEWGYASLAELRSLRVRGLTMERDLHFPIATRTVAAALARVA